MKPSFKSCFIFILLSFFFSESTLFAQKFSQKNIVLSGHVVDARGKPLANAQVSNNFGFYDGQFQASQLFKTNQDGYFEGSFSSWKNPFMLMAYSEDMKQAGMLQAENGKNLKIVVKPTVEISGESPSFIQFSHKKFPLFGTSEKSFKVSLPPGEWEWEVYDSYYQSKSGTFILSQGLTHYNLGKISLPPCFMSLHEGKELPPWTVTEARNVSAGKSKLKDFRGKWLLVEFWGYW